MAHLKLTQIQAITLRGIRNVTPDSERKALKKATFSDIKTRLGIPSSMKIAVEIDDAAHQDYLVIKQKGTGLKLLASTDGMYAGVDVPPPAQQPTATATSAPSVDRFTSANPSGLKKISRTTLLSILREFGDGDVQDVTVADVPAGLPAISQDGLVLDNSNGDLYFRA